MTSALASKRPGLGLGLEDACMALALICNMLASNPSLVDSIQHYACAFHIRRVIKRGVGVMGCCERLFAVAESPSPITTTSQSTMETVVAVTGSSISLSCAADAQAILVWDYYPYKSAQRITIFSGGSPSYNLDPRFVLTGCQLNNCSLVIRNLQLKDAGRFVCLLMESGACRNLSISVLGTYSLKKTSTLDF